MKCLHRIPFSRAAHRFVSTSIVRNAKLHHAEYTTAKAHEYLSSFKGGQIKLEKFECFDDIACITIDNPEKKNGLTGKMMADLFDVVSKLEMESLKYRALILKGAEGVFCSGGDLDFVKKILTPEDGYVMCSFMGETLHRLSVLPIVSIAQIEGFALGGGSELASACDLRVCQKNAKVGFVQGRMGVSPGWGGASKLIAALGRSQAIKLLATASVLKCDTLKELGFANYIYDTDNEFTTFIEKFTAIDLATVHAAKRIVIDVSAQSDWEKRLSAERDIFVTLWGGELQKQAIAAKTKHK